VRTVLAYNENHWDEAPQVTEIIYTPIKEAATRVAALLSGEVDFVQDVPVQDIDRLAQTPMASPSPRDPRTGRSSSPMT
jgi:peptide/nickel transport system substrate-binding protein